MAKKEPMDFEARVLRLQAVVEALEKGELPLEKSMALYKEGVGLVQDCREELHKAKHDITIFSQGVFKEFEPEAGADARSGGAEG